MPIRWGRLCTASDPLLLQLVDPPRFFLLLGFDEHSRSPSRAAAPLPHSLPVAPLPQVDLYKCFRPADIVRATVVRIGGWRGGLRVLRAAPAAQPGARTALTPAGASLRRGPRACLSLSLRMCPVPSWPTPFRQVG